MSKVTYRGVPYDTTTDRQVRDLGPVELTYRGVSYTKSFNALGRIKRAAQKKDLAAAARMAFTRNMKASEVA